MTSRPTVLPARRPTALLLAAVVAATGFVQLAAPQPAQAAVPTVGIVPGCAVPYDTRIEDMVVQRGPHPKVVLGAGDAAQAKALDAAAAPTGSDPEGIRVRVQLKSADNALAAPLPTATGNRSLVARASTERMMTLWFAMNVVQDGRSNAVYPATAVKAESVYADRILKEVDAFVRMPSWGSAAPLVTDQDDMLGTAEIATAVAVGYSLVGDRMTATQRGVVRNALLQRALGPACSGWTQGSWMVDATHNWGVVVNSGTALAAVVVADSDPRLAAGALTQSLVRANRAIVTSAADGGTPEGPNYAGLVQQYTAYLSATMLNSFGEGGLAKVVQVPHAARFLTAMKGPSGQMFSYSDSNTGRIIPLLPLFNARRGGDPLGDAMADELVMASAHPLLAFWHRGPGRPAAAAEPTALAFPTTGVATLRSGWDAAATYVGVKAGSNRANHSHLDLGSFVLDARGHRFVSDHGSDSYSLPGYFTAPQRYGYYRVGTAAHSTLARPGVNQSATASAPMSAILGATGGGKAVQVSTTQALGMRSASRAFVLTGTTTTVQDRFRAPGTAPTTLRWSVHTPARVAISTDGRTATLQRGSAFVDVRILGSAPGRFRASAPPAAPAGGISNAGTTVLWFDTVTARGADGVQAGSATVSFTVR